MQRKTLRSRAVTARNRRLAEKALETGMLKIRGAAASTATAVSNDVARELGGFVARRLIHRNKVEVSLLVASVGHDVDRAIAVIRAGVNAGLRSPSPPKYFEKLGPNSRIATATHEAGHAARAKMLGRSVNFVEIYPGQVCNAGMSQDLRERIQFSLGGYCAEYWLHGVGEKYPDGVFLEEALWAALGGETPDHGDIAHALVDILKLLPDDASDEQIFAELKHQMDICYEMLKMPGAQAGLERIAAALAEREHLTGNEVDRVWLGKM